MSGRFRKPLDPEALRFSTSLPVDKRLYAEDILGSIAHVRMLGARGIIPRAEAKKIERSLQAIGNEIRAGKIRFDEGTGGGRFAGEDIHMAIEHRLIRKAGTAGGKLHTARSRNDQVALDERLYLRDTIGKILAGIRAFQSACLRAARKYRGVAMPGYTHLQRAQPVLLAHHLLAYISMTDRDRERFEDCRRRVNRLPLGAGALAGTSHPIDRRMVARFLRFDDIVVNSIDAVSDRDVQIEFLACCALTMMHLSRFAEELVLWSSEEWRFAEIGDAFTTGSSIMPQKKNPDMCELVRGKTGRVYGDLVALLTVMKGLPLSYNRDMQEDKEPLFDAADTVRGCLAIFARMLPTVKFSARRFEGEEDGFLATELADYLVRKGMPFRKAHAVVGAISRESLDRGKKLSSLPLEAYRRHSRLFDRDVVDVLSAHASVKLKKSEGSTSPAEVAKAMRYWSRILGRA